MSTKNYEVGVFQPSFSPSIIKIVIPRIKIHLCVAVQVLAGFWSGRLFTVYIPQCWLVSGGFGLNKIKRNLNSGQAGDRSLYNIYVHSAFYRIVVIYLYVFTQCYNWSQLQHSDKIGGFCSLPGLLRIGMLLIIYLLLCLPLALPSWCLAWKILTTLKGVINQNIGIMFLVIGEYC